MIVSALAIETFSSSFFFYRTTVLSSRGEAAHQMYTGGSVICTTTIIDPLSRFRDLVRSASQGRRMSRRRRVPGRVPRRARRDQTSSGRCGGLVGAQSSVTVTGCIYIRQRALPGVIRRAS